MTEYLVILTVQIPSAGGFQQAGISGTVTPEPGMTRHDLYEWARGQLPSSARTGATLFFSAEPNTLGGTP